MGTLANNASIRVIEGGGVTVDGACGSGGANGIKRRYLLEMWISGMLTELSAVIGGETTSEDH